MAKGYKHLKRGSGGHRFVSIEHWIMDSEAWKASTCTARSLYLELCKIYNGKNNGRIYLSQRDAAQLLNVSLPTAFKYFHQLEEKGFIVETTKGHLGGVGKGIASEYRLTAYEWNGQKPTKEFASWKPDKI